MISLLHIGIFDSHEGQPSLRNALRGISDHYVEFNHSSYRGRVNSLLVNEYKKHPFNVVFFQIQQAGVLSVNVLKSFNRKGIKMFNFTGDVRQPIPKWYKEVAPYVTTLFSNKTDSDHFKSLGFSAEYFQVGYNIEYYNTTGPKANGPEIVFMGNNYSGKFPLSGLRADMVSLLQERYGSRFGVFGNGWTNSRWLKQEEEAAVYRNCKIAINLSHFDLKRYSSDRLFRILGCGAFCLSHKYQEIEAEFDEGNPLIWWRNFEDLCYLIDLYLLPENDALRLSIAHQGNQLCEASYTWKHRIETQLLPMILNEKLD